MASTIIESTKYLCIFTSFPSNLAPTKTFDPTNPSKQNLLNLIAASKLVLQSEEDADFAKQD